MAFLGDILSVGANLGGALIDRKTQQETNQANLQAVQETNQTNLQIANQNLELQKEKYNYEKELQERLFGREDNSYQRTVADMRQAGLSPLTMNGTNSAGNVISSTTPQNNFQAIAPNFESSQVSSSFNSIADTLSNMSNNHQQTLLNQEELKQKRVDTEYKRYEKLLNLQNKILTNENLSQDKKDKQLSRIEKQLDISQKRLDLMLSSETYSDRKSQIQSDTKKKQYETETAKSNSSKAKSEAKVAESTVDSQINKSVKDAEKVQQDIQKSAQEREIENTNFQQAKVISQQFGVPMYALRSPREFIAYYNLAKKSKIIKPTRAMKKFIRYLKKFEGQKDSERIGFSVINAINQSGQLGVNAFKSLKSD